MAEEGRRRTANRRAPDNKAKSPAIQELELVERKRLARGVSHGGTVYLCSPRNGAKDGDAEVFRRLRGSLALAGGAGEADRVL